MAATRDAQHVVVRGHARARPRVRPTRQIIWAGAETRRSTLAKRDVRLTAARHASAHLAREIGARPRHNIVSRLRGMPPNTLRKLPTVPGPRVPRHLRAQVRIGRHSPTT